MVFRQFNRRVKMYPVLRRMADLRPGAFLVVEGTTPTLFYASETWIGKVAFEEGGENQNAFTRLDARIRCPLNRMEISKKGILNKFAGWTTDKEDNIQVPESDFSQKFMVSGTDTDLAKKFLDPAVSGAIMRIGNLGQPFVNIDRNTVRVEVERDLSSPRKEPSLAQFLADAETIIERAAQ